MYTIIDIETTGLLRMGPLGFLSDDSEILSFSWMRVTEDKILDPVDYGTIYFYKPYFKCEENAKAFAAHGLRREFMQQFENQFEDNLKLMATLCTGTTLVGKNSEEFDIPFIEEFLRKHGGNLGRMQTAIGESAAGTASGQTYVSIQSSTSLDMQKLFAPYFRTYYYQHEGATTSRNGTLSEYIKYTKGAQEMVDRYANRMMPDPNERRAHNSLYDVIMTYVVFLQYLINKIEEEKAATVKQESSDLMPKIDVF